jgi:levansucrase
MNVSSTINFGILTFFYAPNNTLKRTQIPCTANGYQEYRSLYNKAYYGGDDNYFNSSKNSLLARTDRDSVIKANAAVGIIELNDDYTLKTVMKPLVTANLVTDEIERPNVVKINGKWYLFTITKGYNQRVDGFPSDNTYMLGYVSDNLTGPYKPLNDTGLVLTGNEGYNSRTYTYAYYGMPVSSGSNNLLITSYMTNRNVSSTQHSTFAPSFLLTVNGNQTQVQQNSVLEQGQITTNKLNNMRKKDENLFSSFFSHITFVKGFTIKKRNGP